MAKEKINVLEIIKTIMADPRFINVVSEILNDISNDTMKSIAHTTTKTKKAPVDWSAKSNAALRTAYGYRKKHKLEIEPDLNTTLATRFSGYDPERKIFTGRGRGHKKAQQIRILKRADFDIKTDWSAKSNAALRTAYGYRKKHKLEIEPDLNTTLATRFPGYDPERKTFTGRGRGHKKAQRVRIINWAEKSDAILRKAYKHRKKTGIKDDLNAELAKRFPGEYDPATRTFLKKPKMPHDSKTNPVQQGAISAQHPTEKTQTATPTKLTVKLKIVKQSLDATYTNVYVNGKLILRNHANTDLKILGDGTLLSVHGIVTDNKDLPQRPLFLIYDTNLVANKWASRDKFSGYSVYAQYITPTPDGLNVTLSNKCTLILNNEKLKRLAGATRFEFER